MDVSDAQTSSEARRDQELPRILGGIAAEQREQKQQRADARAWRGKSATRNLSRMGSNDTQMHMKAESTRAAFKRPSWWVLAFGWSLAACAGIVNAAAYRTFGHFVSHATGSTTSIALGLEGVSHGKHDWEKPTDASKLLVAFLLGAYACGLLIDKNQVRLGGKALYGAALIGNATLLVLSVLTWDVKDDSELSACLAAMACGLQNAMCTSHFGAIVRTTHVTGTITDIGSTTGRMTMIFLRKRCRCRRLNVLERAEIGVDARKVLVLAPMWLSFLLGSMAGAFLQDHAGVYALLLPASLTFVVGATYALFRQRLKTQFKNMERRQLQGELDQINATLERAQTFVMERRRNGTGQEEDEAASDLEDEFEQMVGTMHCLAADLEDLHIKNGFGVGGSGDSPVAVDVPESDESDSAKNDLEVASPSVASGEGARKKPFTH